MKPKPLNLKIETKTVNVETRTFKTKYKIVTLPPDFGMSDSARKEFGLSNPIKYWWWKFQMKRKWKKKHVNSADGKTK